jgi:hypothetical protein
VLSFRDSFFNGATSSRLKPLHLFAQLSKHAIHYRCFNGDESIQIGSEVLSGF